MGKTKAGDSLITKWGKYGSNCLYLVWSTQADRPRNLNKVSHKTVDPEIIKICDPDYYKILQKDKEILENVEIEKDLEKGIPDLEKRETIKQNFLSWLK